jgi:hypothetical protein
VAKRPHQLAPRVLREICLLPALWSDLVHAARAAPDCGGERGPIDEEVGVALYLDDPLVPPALQVVDRVSPMPGEQGAEMSEQGAAVAVLMKPTSKSSAPRKAFANACSVAVAASLPSAM